MLTTFEQAQVVVVPPRDETVLRKPSGLAYDPPVGARYGKLVTVESSILLDRRRYVKTQCDCGTVKTVRLDALTKGQQVSCGCHRNAQNSVANLKHGLGGVGKSRHPMYNTWSCMVQRTTNPKATGYSYYGAKGIRVDPKWLEFAGFLQDMGSTWFAGGTLERLDNAKDYCLENCVWATRAVQTRNRSVNYVLECQGTTHSVDSLAAELGIPASRLRSKLNRHRGVPVADIVQSLLTGSYLKIVKSEHVNKPSKPNLPRP